MRSHTSCEDRTVLAYTTDGAIESFQALAAPVLSVGAATNPTRTSASVSGPVTAQGLPTYYHFDYITQGAYEQALANGQDPFAGALQTHQQQLTRLNEEGQTVDAEDYEAHTVTAAFEELQPGQTYHYALVASNELGEVSAPSAATFTTLPPTAPIVTTGPAQGVSQTSATITASIDTRGLSTLAYFEFATAPESGNLLPATVLPAAEGTSSTSEQIQLAFSGQLQPATTYYYRALASNRDGSSYGAEQSFTTPGLPAVFSPASLAPLVPAHTIAELDAKEAKPTPARPASKPLTRAQKLKKALAACHKKKRGHGRKSCEAAARHRYGAKHAKKK